MIVALDNSDDLKSFDEILHSKVPIALSASWDAGWKYHGFALGRDPSVGHSAWFPFSYLEDEGISDEFKQFLRRDAGIIGHGLKKLIRSLLALDFPTPKIIMDTQDQHISLILLVIHIYLTIFGNMQSYQFKQDREFQTDNLT